MNRENSTSHQNKGHIEVNARTESKEDMIATREEGKEAKRAQHVQAKVEQDDTVGQNHKTSPDVSEGGTLQSDDTLYTSNSEGSNV